jgi:hypothetical protein
VYLEAFRWPTDYALEEPAVKLKLEANLLVVVFIHSAGQLRVADYVAVTIEYEEVRTPDDHDWVPIDSGFALEFWLVNHGNTIPNGFQGSEEPLVSLYDTYVLVSSERGEMFLLVNSAECLDDLLEVTGFRFRNTSCTQI